MIQPRRYLSFAKPVAGVLFAIILLISQPTTAAPPYIVARAPQLNAAELVETWTPFLRRISYETGVALQLQVYPNRSQFEDDLLNGIPDFAFGNPYYAVLAHARHGYVSLVRDDSNQLRGILVTRKDSGIDNVEQLNGQLLAFPDPNAMAASLYPRALLAERFNISYKTIYVGPHENVYRAVFLGRATAGGGAMRTFMREPAELREQLTVLYETPGVAPHPLMAHPRVPVEVRDLVATAVLNMRADAEGRKLLDNVTIKDPVRVDFQRDYGDIASLGLEKYTLTLDSARSTARAARETSP